VPYSVRAGAALSNCGEGDEGDGKESVGVVDEGIANIVDGDSYV